MACTTRLLPASKVTELPPLNDPLELIGRSKTILKCSVYVGLSAQKWPEVIQPRISVSLTLVKLDASVRVPAEFSLNNRLACPVAGKVNRAIPVRAVVVSSVLTPLPRVTAYEPAAADSALCVKLDVAAPLTAPTVGRIGTSAVALHPGPDRWLRLKPVIVLSP